MSAAKHTPGPWAYSRWDQFGEARFYVAQADGAPYTPNYSDAATLIAETVSSERVAIQEANACLIAAAPDLLEALKLLIHEVDESAVAGATDFGWKTATDKTRAAIAKATGGEA